MSAPRLEIDLGAIERNTRTLVERLAPRGIRVTGVTKAVLGLPAVGAAMVRGGASGLGDSRVENLARLESAGIGAPRTLIRSPMISQADAVVRSAGTSLNSEGAVLDALAAAAERIGTTHAVVLMVELGDLREGVLPEDVVALARTVASRRGLALAGLGTNLACQSGVVPDQAKMEELSGLVAAVEAAVGSALSVVSGGNSASLAWALAARDVGRVDDLRVGEAILLGLDPLSRCPIAGLRTDAIALVAELIEVQTKPARPWGAARPVGVRRGGRAPGHRFGPPGDPGRGPAGRGALRARAAGRGHRPRHQQRPPGRRPRRPPGAGRGRAGLRRRLRGPAARRDVAVRLGPPDRATGARSLAPPRRLATGRRV